MRTNGSKRQAVAETSITASSATPWPIEVQTRLDQLESRAGQLEAQVEHDFGGSDSGALGARVEALETAVEGYGKRLEEIEQRILGTRSIPGDALARLAKVEAEVSLLGISDRLSQHSTRLAAIEADREEDGTGARS